MGIFGYQTDADLLQKSFKCRICGKEIKAKVKKYDVCKDCVLSAKLICRKKSEISSKHMIISIALVGVLILLILINILAAIRNCIVPALVFTGVVVVLGALFLGLALDE